MPTRTENVPAELFMEHSGVCIFHVYKNDDFDQGARTYWFATHEDGSDDAGHGTDGVFDVRYLPAPATGPKLDDHPPYVSVDEGRKAGFESYEDWKASEEYARRKELWDQWHETGETEAIENTIRHAIESGVLTADGVREAADADR